METVKSLLYLIKCVESFILTFCDFFRSIWFSTYSTALATLKFHLQSNKMKKNKFSVGWNAALNSDFLDLSKKLRKLI
jgi:hypothetical protein